MVLDVLHFSLVLSIVVKINCFLFVHILALVVLPLTLWALTGHAAHKLQVRVDRKVDVLPYLACLLVWAAHQITSLADTCHVVHTTVNEQVRRTLFLASG